MSASTGPWCGSGCTSGHSWARRSSGGHVDRPTEGGQRMAEADVVDQHDDDVRALSPWVASRRSSAAPWPCGRRLGDAADACGSGIGSTVRSSCARARALGHLRGGRRRCRERDSHGQHRGPEERISSHGPSPCSLGHCRAQSAAEPIPHAMLPVNRLDAAQLRAWRVHPAESGYTANLESRSVGDARSAGVTPRINVAVAMPVISREAATVHTMVTQRRWRVSTPGQGGLSGKTVASSASTPNCQPARSQAASRSLACSPGLEPSPVRLDCGSASIRSTRPEVGALAITPRQGPSLTASSWLPLARGVCIHSVGEQRGPEP